MTTGQSQRPQEPGEQDDAAVLAQAAKGGRPSLDDGISPVLQVRLGERTYQQLVERAKRDHTTPSGLARQAIRAFLASERPVT